MTAPASQTSLTVVPPEPASHPSLGRRIIKFLSVVLAAYTASHVMIKLSGTALWLPREWRIGVDIFATLIGTLAFRLGSEREKRDPPLAPGVAKESPEGQAQAAQFREREKRRAL
ncbi:MAG TPA: hypothetical protein VEV81_11710, partial [Pyrinomonadaceae bacterium]|nr:hypothetical protein [Pyrinomonadaceae bacterium]